MPLLHRGELLGVLNIKDLFGVATVHTVTRAPNGKVDYKRCRAEAIEAVDEMVPTWMLNRRKDVDTGEDGHLIGTDVEIRLRDRAGTYRRFEVRGRSARRNAFSFAKTCSIGLKSGL